MAADPQGVQNRGFFARLKEYKHNTKLNKVRTAAEQAGVLEILVKDEFFRNSDLPDITPQQVFDDKFDFSNISEDSDKTLANSAAGAHGAMAASNVAVTVATGGLSAPVTLPAAMGHLYTAYQYSKTDAGSKQVNEQLQQERDPAYNKFGAVLKPYSSPAQIEESLPGQMQTLDEALQGPAAENVVYTIPFVVPDQNQLLLLKTIQRADAEQLKKHAQRLNAEWLEPEMEPNDDAQGGLRTPLLRPAPRVAPR